MRTKAYAVVQTVVPVAMDNLMQEASDEFALWMGTTNPTSIQALLDKMDVDKLKQIEAQIEETVMQETSVHTLAKFFMNAHTPITEVDTMTKKTLASMEAAFEYVYCLSYYGDTGKFNHAEFVTHLQHAITAARAKASMDDV